MHFFLNLSCVYVCSLCKIFATGEVQRKELAKFHNLRKISQPAKFRNPTIATYGAEENKNGNTVAGTVLVKKKILFSYLYIYIYKFVSKQNLKKNSQKKNRNVRIAKFRNPFSQPPIFLHPYFVFAITFSSKLCFGRSWYRWKY